MNFCIKKTEKVEVEDFSLSIRKTLLKLSLESVAKTIDFKWFAKNEKKNKDEFFPKQTNSFFHFFAKFVFLFFLTKHC